MASMKEEAQCVFWFHETKSPLTVQKFQTWVKSIMQNLKRLAMMVIVKEMVAAWCEWEDCWRCAWCFSTQSAEINSCLTWTSHTSERSGKHFAQMAAFMRIQSATRWSLEARRPSLTCCFCYGDLATNWRRQWLPYACLFFWWGYLRTDTMSAFEG
jgi:hypothetical protein